MSSNSSQQLSISLQEATQLFMEKIQNFTKEPSWEKYSEICLFLRQAFFSRHHRIKKEHELMEAVLCGLANDVNKLHVSAWSYALARHHREHRSNHFSFQLMQLIWDINTDTLIRFQYADSFLQYVLQKFPSPRNLILYSEQMRNGELLAPPKISTNELKSLMYWWQIRISRKFKKEKIVEKIQCLFDLEVSNPNLQGKEVESVWHEIVGIPSSTEPIFGKEQDKERLEQNVLENNTNQHFLDLHQAPNIDQQINNTSSQENLGEPNRLHPISIAKMFSRVLKEALSIQTITQQISLIEKEINTCHNQIFELHSRLHAWETELGQQKTQQREQWLEQENQRLQQKLDEQQKTLESKVRESVLKQLASSMSLLSEAISFYEAESELGVIYKDMCHAFSESLQAEQIGYTGLEFELDDKETPIVEGGYKLRRGELVRQTGPGWRIRTHEQQWKIVIPRRVQRIEKQERE